MRCHKSASGHLGGVTYRRRCPFVVGGPGGAPQERARRGRAPPAPGCRQSRPPAAGCPSGAPPLPAHRPWPSPDGSLRPKPRHRLVRASATFDCYRNRIHTSALCQHRMKPRTFAKKHFSGIVLHKALISMVHLEETKAL